MPDNLKSSVNGVEINSTLLLLKVIWKLKNPVFFSVKKLQYYLQLKFIKGMGVSQKINLDFLLVTVT